MKAVDFYDVTLPSAGLRVIALPQGGGFKHLFGDTNSWLAEASQYVDAKREINVYFGCATYKDASSRKQSNVAFVRSFWADIDCGPGKPYGSARDAARVVLEFCLRVGLARPYIVKSGNGIHAYWPMTADMDPATWKDPATLFKAMLKAEGVFADPSRTADEASVLRPPGTHHRKGAPKLVKVVVEGEVSELAEFQAKLMPYANLVQLPSEAGEDFLPAGRPVAGMVMGNSDLTAGVEYRPSNGHKIAEQCGVIALLRDTKGVVDQPTWYFGMGVLAFTEDGDALCHEWSSGDPRYSEAETNKKIAQIRANQRPTSCEKLGEQHPVICGACPHNGKIKTPYALGLVSGAAQSGQTVDLPAGREASGSQRHVTAVPKLMREVQAMPALNDRYGHVADWGEQPTYVKFSGDGQPVPIQKDGLREIMANVFVQPNDTDAKRINAYQFWITHPDRLEYDVAHYDPENLRSNGAGRVLNLWTGLARAGRRGCWSKMRRHLFRVICGGRSAEFRYLIRWLAHAVQHPGTAPGTVVILKSEVEGTGKSTVAGWLVVMFGIHGAELNTADQLIGKFNPHLETLSFIAVNEPAFAGDHNIERKLKSMITEARWPIEPKFRRPYWVPNCAHMMFTTNATWAVAAGQHARRYFVLDVDPSKVGDQNYFRKLHAEANGGGIEAMLGFLLSLDIGQFKPAADMPFTHALQEQQILSASPIVQWALDLAERDQCPFAFSGGGIITFGGDAATADLHKDYEAFAEKRGGRPMTVRSFGLWFARLGLANTSIGPRRRRGWALPSPDTFRAAVRTAAGIRG